MALEMARGRKGVSNGVMYDTVQCPHLIQCLFNMDLLATLCNPKPDSLQEIPRLWNFPHRLLPVNLSFTTPQIHIAQFDHLRLLDELVAKQKSQEDRYVDVWRQESLRTEVTREETVVSVKESDDAAEAYTEVGQKWLQWCFPG